MSVQFKRNLLSVAVLTACAMTAQTALAGATITFGEDKYLSANFATQASYFSQEDASNSGKDRSKDFRLESARIILEGSMNKYIKGLFITEKSGGGSDVGSNIEIIDAQVLFNFMPEFSIRAGRFLSASDRANLAGPYASMGGGYWSTIASRYGWNGGVIGRDDGVQVEGEILDGTVLYSLGAFDGGNIYRFTPSSVPGGKIQANPTSAVKDNLMYAGRLHVNFWDKEGVSYGTLGNYYGSKDILSIGIAGRMKKDGVVAQRNGLATTTSADFLTGDYKSYSVDFLMEKKNLGPGTLSAEAAYYYYDNDGVLLSEQGKAYSAGLGYLFNQQIGWGKLMPFARYQKFDADGSTNATRSVGATNSVYNNTKGENDTKRFEIGATYVIAPYSTMISAVYGKTDFDVLNTSTSTNDVKLLVQMIF